MIDAVLPGASVRDMRSNAGHDYRIFVWQPEPRPRGPLPVLYLLDGNGMFPIAAAALALQSRRAERTGVAPSIIVGIGYPAAHWIDARRRTCDYTPPVAGGRLAQRPGNREWGETGGADHFLDFIQHELAAGDLERIPHRSRPHRAVRSFLRRPLCALRALDPAYAGP